MSKGREVCIRAVGRFAAAWRGCAAILLMGFGCAPQASAAAYRDCYKTQLFATPTWARCASTLLESLQLASVYDHYFDIQTPPGFNGYGSRSVFKVGTVPSDPKPGSGVACGVVEYNSRRNWTLEGTGIGHWSEWSPYEPINVTSCSITWTVHTQKQIIDILRTSPPVC